MRKAVAAKLAPGRDLGRGAWRAWLESLATDAEAATAAACLYAEMTADAREALLAALAEDVPDLNVPPLAVYGPLMAVEEDPERWARIQSRANASLSPITAVRRALMGSAEGNVRIVALVIPLYLDFVRVLIARLVRGDGFDWVRQEPLVTEMAAPHAGVAIDEIELSDICPERAVDELAHAVLAHERNQRELPQVLRDCADLFSART